MTAVTRIGVVFLCHDELDVAAGMVRTWHDGGAAVTIHVDKRTSESDYQKMRQSLADLADIAWADRIQCDCGACFPWSKRRRARRRPCLTDSRM